MLWLSQRGNLSHLTQALHIQRLSCYLKQSLTFCKSRGSYSSFPNPKFQQLQEERFRFTPVKVAKPVPRIWDRQPSTPFLARPKSRKVWKRFRSSFNSMKALQRLISAQSGPNDHDDLYTEINTSRNEEYMRGVKRRCLVHNSEEQGEATTSRGRSFLETKWESEASGKRRKSPSRVHIMLLF